MNNPVTALEANKIIGKYVADLSLEIGISRKQIADSLLYVVACIVRDNPAVAVRPCVKDVLLSNIRSDSQHLQKFVSVDENFFSGPEYAYLKSEPLKSLVAIRKAIFDILYPRVFSDGELRMIKILSGGNGDIRTINCDCGLINDLHQSLRAVNYDACSLSDYEEALLALPIIDDGDIIVNLPSGSETIFIQFERKEYSTDTKRIPGRKFIDLECVDSQVARLSETQSIVFVVPTALLAYPGAKEFRKKMIESGHLRAVMDLRQKSVQERMSVMILTGKEQSSFITLQSNWDESIKLVFNRDENPNIPIRSYRQRLAEQLLLLESGGDTLPGWNKVDVSETDKSDLLFPDYFAKNEAGQRAEINLQTYAELINPDCVVEKSERVLRLPFSELKPEKPIAPVELSMLSEYEGHDSSSVRFYRIQTENVVYIAVVDGIVFTGYSEGVKGQVVATTEREVFFIGIRNDNLTPQFLAQILHSDIMTIQIRACAYFARHTLAPLSCNMKESLMRIRLRDCSFIEQMTSYGKVAESQIRREENNWKKNFEAYTLTMRQRKHAVGNKMLRLSADWKRLTEYYRENGGIINSQEIIGVKKRIKVADLMDSIGSCISEIRPMIEGFADADFNYGETVRINILNFIKNYIANIQSKEITVDTNFLDIEGLGFDIEFPEKALRIILDNIVSNAMLHGFKKVAYEKKIAFVLSIEGNLINLDIKNNGLPLIETEDRKLFNPDIYQQKSRKMIDGHLCEHIGNHQSREIMDRYGGWISLHPIDDTILSEHPEDSYTVAYRLKFNRIID